MRVLMTVHFDTEKAGRAIADGTLPELMTSVFGELKPEAAYFAANKGRRTAFVVFDLKQASDIPSIAEPFFQKLGAEIAFTPVMDFADVQEGLRKLDPASR